MTDAAPARPYAPNPPAGRWAAWIGVLLVLIAAASSIGGPQGPVLGLIVVVETVVGSGWPALVFILASVGIGRLVGSVFSRRGRWVTLALGVAGMLIACHVLGTLGALGVASVPLAVGGLVALVVTQRRRGLDLRPPPAWAWIGLPGVALLLTAAASPPGTLWASEYGGYDVLSYHLQLPQEWVLAGNTRPVEHNVYSFLPGALEVAFTHLGHLTLAPSASAADGPPPLGLLDGGGWRLLSAHALHGCLTIVSAGAIARVTRALGLRAGVHRSTARAASALAGGLVLCTPWTIVVGSLAYNEMGVVALGAGAMLAAIPARRRPISRACAATLLVGAACLVKPTALVLVAPVVGALLLLSVPKPKLLPALAAGAVVGLAALSPWLVRNAVMTGNPVFPLAASGLGTGHWTEGQAQRFAEAHRGGGSIPDRLGLLAWSSPDAGPDDPHVVRWRGAANPQWMLAFPAALAGLAVLVLRRRTRTIGGVMAIGLAAQLAAWMALTHMQSRFLLPCLLTIAPAAALGCTSCAGRPFAALIGGVPLVIAQAGAAWMIYADQLNGAPASMLLPGPAASMGEPYTPEVGGHSPVAYVNHELPPDARVVLVGGATPLYITRSVRYATVWDTPPVLALLGGDAEPGAYVLVNTPELARQSRSGYLDPRLTPGVIRGVIRGVLGARPPVKRWPGLGIELYRVPVTDGRSGITESSP